MTRTGDTALELLRAGADTSKKDVDGFLALELAPDKEVCVASTSSSLDTDLSGDRFGNTSTRWPNGKVSNSKRASRGVKISRGDRWQGKGKRDACINNSISALPNQRRVAPSSNVLLYRALH